MAFWYFEGFSKHLHLTIVTVDLFVLVNESLLYAQHYNFFLICKPADSLFNIVRELPFSFLSSH